jgi:hypothetical protein
VIPVAHPIRKPRNFTRDCETPGKAWEQAHPASNKFPALWRKFQPQLAEGFHDRCGWWAMRIGPGAVDHYLSKKFHRDRAYDWSNYRYIAPCVNSSKGNKDDKVLDPFEIEPGWFEVQLPSMLLKRTALVPSHLQAKADFTIKELRLVSGHKVRRYRRGWYEGYKKGLITDAGLAAYAPLVADAVTKWINTKGLPLP